MCNTHPEERVGNSGSEVSSSTGGGNPAEPQQDAAKDECHEDFRQAEVDDRTECCPNHRSRDEGQSDLPVDVTVELGNPGDLSRQDQYPVEWNYY